MTVKEAYYEWFLKPVVEYIQSEPQELIDFLSNANDIHLVERFFDYDAVDKRIKDPTYLSIPVEIDGNKVLFNDVPDVVKEFVIKHLSKDITEIELPSRFFEDITFLEQFPNLRKLTINGHCKMSKEEINFIKTRTNIKEIATTNGALVPYDYLPEEGEILLKSPSQVFISGDLINRAINNHFRVDSVEAVVGDLELDLSLIEKAYSYAEKDETKPIKSVEIRSAKLKDETYTRQNLITMKINNDKEVEKLVFNGRHNPSKLSEIIRKIESERPVKEILLTCENCTYDNMYYLNPIAKKHDLKINYGDLLDCTLEEFTAMRETIDWFNDLVRQYNLSPAEILTYAYDIMKTFDYKENEDDKQMPRSIHSIVMSDYIVCLGYSKFLKQILKENGISAIEVGVVCNAGTKDEGGHSKTLVKLDDDKYDIHGVYCVDATWDRSRGKALLVETSDNKHYVKYGIDEDETIKREFDPLGLYRNYLVTAKEYPVLYPGDTQPKLYQMANDNTLDELLNIEPKDKYSIAAIDFQELFGGNISRSDLRDYMYCHRPSLEVIKNILYNVRIAQGYTSEEALAAVEDNIDLNQMIDEYNRKTPTFFQSAQKK